jgi:hypothetical protein
MQHYRLFACTAVLLISLCGSSFAECSLNTVRGTWGWQAHGTAMMTVPGSATPAPVPFASLGIMTFDHDGRYTSSGTISVGGQVQQVAVPGTIQVNPDCTATDTYAIGPFQGSDRLVILDNGNEMQMMPIKHPLGPVAATGTFRRISWGEPRCSTDMIRGLYEGTGEGTMMIQMTGQPQPVPTPVSGIVAATFQRIGVGTMVSKLSLGGSIFDLEFPATSIVVNPDCTATLEWRAVAKQNPGQTLTGSMLYLVLDQGNEVLGLETRNSVGPSIAIQNLKRVSMTAIDPGQ